MTKILLVDDEPLFVKGLKHSLEQEGYTVITASTGTEGLKLLSEQEVHLVLLDLMLPEMDGMTVCQKIRQKSSLPVIMLTAKDDDIDKILGLEIGADDYITKPFNTRELLARIKAVLRRSQETTTKAILEQGLLKIDIQARRVFLNNKEVPLTSKEFDILKLLASQPGRVYTRENLLDLVWGYDFYGDLRTVDVHIRRMREKLEPDPNNPQYIKTKWGQGYYLGS